MAYIYIRTYMYMYTHSYLQSLYLQCTCKIGSRNSFGYIKQPSSHDSLSNEVSRARALQAQAWRLEGRSRGVLQRTGGWGGGILVI